MAIKSSETDIKAEERQTVLDRVNDLIDSPLRLFVFCASLLVISLTAGMLIGTFAKSGSSADDAASVLARPSLQIPATISGEAEVPVASLTEPDRAAIPVDALNYERQDSSSAPDLESAEEDVQGPSVASLPPSLPTLTEKSEDIPAWKRFAALSVPVEGRPMIAMVIDDVGLNKGRVEALVALPEVITLSFLPYAKNLDESSKKTREQGHEVMLHLPMEPLGKDADPGPDALLQSLSLEAIRTGTLKNLDQFGGYVGVNNHMGSKFTAYEEGMAIVMDVLSEKGLLFLDSRTTPTSKGFKLARERGMPAATRDVFIDNEISETAILKQLKIVEKIALEKGIAIAIGHPHRETIAALKKWMPGAVQKGFQFVPISRALTTTAQKD